MKVLIAGVAGYIGSTVASACLDAGISPVIVGSLVTGRREFIVGRAFYEGDIADGACSRIDRAERLLGWRPQYDLAEGISHSLQWAAVREEILPGSGRPSCAALTWAFPSACSYNEVILMGNQHPRGATRRSAARFAGASSAGSPVNTTRRTLRFGMPP